MSVLAPGRASGLRSAVATPLTRTRAATSVSAERICGSASSACGFAAGVVRWIRTFSSAGLT
ncbi:hypothetical protein [Candidatus Frankia alpina]|uniref:hypothetical protein n=1 Tax=Candidatus Frankia alpina TaxID=2699483 RepID=UPI001F3D3E35|nr:hypothetical protein [Candidatus Frankia alpina]